MNESINIKSRSTEFHLTVLVLVNYIIETTIASTGLLKIDLPSDTAQRTCTFLIVTHCTLSMALHTLPYIHTYVQKDSSCVRVHIHMYIHFNTLDAIYTFQFLTHCMHKHMQACTRIHRRTLTHNCAGHISCLERTNHSQ